MNDRYRNSRELLARAEKVIPVASQTFSKSRVQFPEGHAPLFLTHGEGGRVWDVDGNSYVDLICGLLPVVLGYRDPDVDGAVRAQLEKGITFSLPSPLETELAERLVEVIPCAEMVRFGKNGTDATSAAIRLARAFTGRDRVVALGYHGWQDWYIGATTRNKGVPGRVSALTHKLPFNDLEAVKEVLETHSDEVAAVILEPVGAQEPAPGYLEALRELTRDNGTLLVFDEIITGFRVALGGAQAHYGVTPDLAAFGKAMGNGMPISAVVGRSDIMLEMEEVFFSGTFGGETLSIAAAIAVIDKMRREPVIETLWDSGQKLGKLLQEAAQRHGLEDVFQPAGLPPWQPIAISAHEQGSVPAVKTLFLKEMLARGVLVGGSLNVCWAHGDTDLEEVGSALNQTFARLAEELERGALDDRLDIPVVQPVFQPRPNAETGRGKI